MSGRWDLLIRDALLFDGSGKAPHTEDLAVRDGRVAARGPGLDAARADGEQRLDRRRAGLGRA